MSSAKLPMYDTKLMTEIWDSAEDFLYDYQTVGIPMTINLQNATTLYYLLYARYGNTPIANYDEQQFKYKVFSVIFQYGPTWEKRLSVQGILRNLQLSDLVDDGSLSELFSHEGSNGITKSGTGRQVKDSAATTNVDHDNTISVDDVDTTVMNHAVNPGTAPGTNAYDPLTYINSQDASKTVKDDQSVQDETTETTFSGQDVINNTSSDTVEGTDTAEDSRTRTLTRGKLAAYEHLLELLDSDVTGEFISKFKNCFKQFVAPERTWIYVTDVEDEDDEEEDD